MSVSVAIDGPAGAGKSSLAKAVSEKLGFIYVDTGALYRTVGVSLMENNISTDDIEKVEKHLKKISVDLTFKEGKQAVLLNGEDVSHLIRTPEASMMASKTSSIPAVRAFLLELQRKIAREHNCLMDGRDIGTVVLPDAKIKLFVTASAEARADRRTRELQEKGMDVKFVDVLADIKERDYMDMNRKIAPLKQADDAILVDTSEINLAQATEAIYNLIKERL